MSIIIIIIVIMKFEKWFIECLFYLCRAPYYANMVYQSFCHNHHKSHNIRDLFAHAHAHTVCVDTCREFNTHVDIIIISVCVFLLTYSWCVCASVCVVLSFTSNGRKILRKWARGKKECLFVFFTFLSTKALFMTKSYKFDTHIFQLINTMTQLMRFSLHTTRMSSCSCLLNLHYTVFPGMLINLRIFTRYMA